MNNKDNTSATDTVIIIKDEIIKTSVEKNVYQI